jgi:AHBA synthesis associated protein
MDSELTVGNGGSLAPTGFRAVVFDLDGVLVDSSDVTREAFALAYREIVGPGKAPLEEYGRHPGRHFPDILRMMGLPLEMEGPFVRENRRLAHRVRLFDGVRELLEALRARNIGCAVATGKDGPRARSLLAGLKVLPLLDHVVGSDEVARAKPAPDIVLRALDLLDVRRDEAVLIGDAVSDLASAQAAGVSFVAALWGEGSPQSLIDARPDAALGSPAELLTWLLEATA